VSDAEPVLGSPPPINTEDNSRFCTHLIVGNVLGFSAVLRIHDILLWIRIRIYPRIHASD
jgi:hypothetical protein